MLLTIKEIKMPATINQSILENQELNSVIGIAGDWHIQTEWALVAIQKMHSNNIHHIFHLGDFGFDESNQGKEYVTEIDKLLQQYNMFIFVTLGNHENYNIIEQYEEIKGMPGCVRRNENSRIIVLPRGYTWTINNKKFMSFGGANSFDKEYQSLQGTWFPQEQITDADVENGQKTGKVDILFSHEIPTGINIFQQSTQRKIPAHTQAYINESRIQMKKLTDIIKPDIHFHGHYHIDRDSIDTQRVNGEYSFYKTRTICLNKEYTTGNLATLNTKTLQITLGVK